MLTPLQFDAATVKPVCMCVRSTSCVRLCMCIVCVYVCVCAISWRRIYIWKQSAKAENSLATDLILGKGFQS